MSEIANEIHKLSTGLMSNEYLSALEGSLVTKDPKEIRKLGEVSARIGGYTLMRDTYIYLMRYGVPVGSIWEGIKINDYLTWRE